MEATTLALIFAATSQAYSLPPGLLSSICFIESRHEPKTLVENDKGSPSFGICQIKEATARGLGFKGTKTQLLQPKTNIIYAAKYLRHQLDRYHFDIIKAVAAYNAGSHRADTHGQPKNKHYVQKVLLAWSELR